MELTKVEGPGWVDASTSPYRGLNPIASENYINSAVGRHAYGVTTITSVARYYALHGALADFIAAEGLETSAAAEFIRRAEVVYALVCMSHAETDEHLADVPQPHGGRNIARALATGPIDLSVLAGADRSARYARPDWGFWDTYSTVTALFGITDGLGPGKNYDRDVVGPAFQGVIDLAGAGDTIGLDDVRHLHDACLCRASKASDGEWLADLFAGRPGDGTTIAAVIGQTLQLIDAAIATGRIRGPGDIAEEVLFTDLVATHDRSTKIWKHWQGIFLRAEQVHAWNALWSELSNGLDIAGAMTVEDFVGNLADRLDAGLTVGALFDALPELEANARSLADAEHAAGDLDDSSGPERVDTAIRYLGVGAKRWAAYAKSSVGDVTPASDPEVLFGFQGPPDSYHAGEELSPQWTYRLFEQWRERPLKGFGEHLGRILLARHQRVALSKANWRDGRLMLPIRVEAVDGIVFRRFDESSGYPSLRLNRILSMARQVGIFAVDSDGVWHRGPRGGLLD